MSTKICSKDRNLLTGVSVFLHVQSDHEEALFKSQSSTIVALTKGCKSGNVVRDLEDVPAGCGSAVVTSTVVVHVLVRVSESRFAVVLWLLTQGSGFGGSGP